MPRFPTVARRAATVSDIVTTGIVTSRTRGPPDKRPSNPFLFLTLIAKGGAKSDAPSTDSARDGLRDRAGPRDRPDDRSGRRRETARGVRQLLAGRIEVLVGGNAGGDARVRHHPQDPAVACAEIDRRRPERPSG